MDGDEPDYAVGGGILAGNASVYRELTRILHREDGESGETFGVIPR
jgi:hypothetical protein